MTWASVLAFVPAHNSEGKHDATGAFHPEARKFLSDAESGEGQLVLHRFDNRKRMGARAQEILETLRGYRDQDRKVVAVAFFCHGHATGIQAGFRSSGAQRNVDDLAGALAEVAGDGLILPLYACSTAGTWKCGAPGGDGGFADELRDALCRAGVTNCRIDAHANEGHTTVNPNVRRFEGRGSDIGGIGGAYLVSREKRRRWARWRRMLGTPKAKGIARLRFPWWETGLVAQRVSR